MKTVFKIWSCYEGRWEPVCEFMERGGHAHLFRDDVVSTDRSKLEAVCERLNASGLYDMTYEIRPTYASLLRRIVRE